jgi:aldehyde dehydrogenase (NAD+)
MTHAEILAACGLTNDLISGGSLVVTTPVDGSEIARLKMDSGRDSVSRMEESTCPAPR